MKNINDKVFVFTNWGLVEAKIREIVLSGNPTLYIVNIKIDDDNTDIKYDFHYREEQLFDTLKEAVESIRLHFETTNMDVDF